MSKRTDAEVDAMIDAAEERAAMYDGDNRAFIKTDVMNAFYAGADWQRKQSAPRVKPVLWVPDLDKAIEEATHIFCVGAHDHEAPDFSVPLYAHPTAAHEAMRMALYCLEEVVSEFPIQQGTADRCTAAIDALQTALGEQP